METQFVTIPISEYQRLISALQEISKLRAEVQDLGTQLDREAERLSLDIAVDRKRISKLEHLEPQPKQQDRGQILRALLAANDGKMLAKEARRIMGLDKATFSRLLGTMSDRIETRPFSKDKRKLLLIIK